jgi:hypothetical protein
MKSGHDISLLVDIGGLQSHGLTYDQATPQLRLEAPDQPCGLSTNGALTPPSTLRATRVQ